MAKQKKVPHTNDYFNSAVEAGGSLYKSKNLMSVSTICWHDSILQVSDAENQLAEKGKEIERLLLKIDPPEEASGRFFKEINLN